MIEDQIASGDYHHVVCNLCGGGDPVPYAFRLPDQTERYYHVRRVRCCKCGFVYTDPQATEKTLRRIYDMKYDNQHIRDVEESSKNVLRNGRSFFSELAKAERNPAQFRVLDVGCNFGHWLSAGQEFDFDVYGVEVSQHCVDYAHNVHGLKNVMNTDLFDARFPDDFFDYVLLWHVLEHVTDPLALLVEIRRILKRGGTFRIGVPSVYDPVIIANRAVCRLRGSYPYMSSDNLHTCEFTPSTLQMFLIKAGLLIQDLSSYYNSIQNLYEGKNFGFRQRLNITFWWHVAKVFSRKPGHFGIIGPFGDGILSKFGNGIVAHCSKV